MNIFDKIYEEAMKGKQTFRNCFMKLLGEDEERALGLPDNPRLPAESTNRRGRDGVNVAIKFGHTAREDKLGRIHSVPPGAELKCGENGQGVIVPFGHTTVPTFDGGLKIIKPLKQSG